MFPIFREAYLSRQDPFAQARHPHRSNKKMYFPKDKFARPDLRYHWLLAETFVLMQLRSGILPISIARQANLLTDSPLCQQSIVRVLDNMRAAKRFKGLPTPQEYRTMTRKDRARVKSRLRERFVDGRDVSEYARDSDIERRISRSDPLTGQDEENLRQIWLRSWQESEARFRDLKTKSRKWKEQPASTREPPSHDSMAERLTRVSMGGPSIHPDSEGRMPLSYYGAPMAITPKCTVNDDRFGISSFGSRHRSQSRSIDDRSRSSSKPNTWYYQVPAGDLDNYQEVYTPKVLVGPRRYEHRFSRDSNQTENTSRRTRSYAHTQMHRSRRENPESDVNNLPREMWGVHDDYAANSMNKMSKWQARSPSVDSYHHLHPRAPRQRSYSAAATYTHPGQRNTIKSTIINQPSINNFSNQYISTPQLGAENLNSQAETDHVYEDSRKQKEVRFVSSPGHSTSCYMLGALPVRVDRMDRGLQRNRNPTPLTALNLSRAGLLQTRDDRQPDSKHGRNVHKPSCLHSETIWGMPCAWSDTAELTRSRNRKIERRVPAPWVESVDSTSSEKFEPCGHFGR